MIATLVSAVTSRHAIAVLGPLFRYPEASSRREMDEVLRLLRLLDDDDAVRALERFRRDVASLDLDEHQALYTSTFDLAPECSPYLGVHLFGEENADRARLMLGLRITYARRGRPEGKELPDHLAEVLEFAEEYGDDEWREVASLLLLPALSKMAAILTASHNPHRHLIDAARYLVTASVAEGAES